MSSKRHIRRKSCSRKQRLPSSDVGKLVIRKMNRRNGYQGSMDVYRCQFCGGFHIGHNGR